MIITEKLIKIENILNSKIKNIIKRFSHKWIDNIGTEKRVNKNTLKIICLKINGYEKSKRKNINKR